MTLSLKLLALNLEASISHALGITLTAVADAGVDWRRENDMAALRGGRNDTAAFQPVPRINRIPAVLDS